MLALGCLCKTGQWLMTSTKKLLRIHLCIKQVCLVRASHCRGVLNGGRRLRGVQQSLVAGSGSTTVQSLAHMNLARLLRRQPSCVRFRCAMRPQCRAGPAQEATAGLPGRGSNDATRGAAARPAAAAPFTRLCGAAAGTAAPRARTAACPARCTARWYAAHPPERSPSPPC